MKRIVKGCVCDLKFRHGGERRKRHSDVGKERTSKHIPGVTSIEKRVEKHEKSEEFASKNHD